MPNIAMLSCWNHYHARSFVRDLADFPDVRISAVWDSAMERGKFFAEEFGTDFEPDLERLLARGDLDGVIIDSSPAEAGSLIELAAQAGKHVLSDQVLALSLQEANKISKCIERFDIHFAIDMSLRRWPVNIAAKRVVSAGIIGDITSLRIRNAHNGAIGENPLDSRYLNTPYGVFTDLGAHGLYLLRWLLGRPIAVTAIAAHYTDHRAEDNAAALFEFPNGVLVICDTSYAADHSPFSIELYGTSGSFLGGGINGVHRKLLNPSDSTIRLFAPEEKKQALNEAAAMGEAGESTLSLWLKAMEGEAGLPNAVQDGIALAETLEALYLSAQSGQKVYFDSLKA
ncbi:Gfo/Idh/MocA family protein [Paenibacillus solani]|uniref:Oxidoreductase n=1 Tax=Paenibacillus solani TaxID=1705565 RepID=A0A0M1NKL9_9BACL|nr:Gfo/Idh/MocA family oxidoreductase [Paenibacillus solani]KOR82575.1 hypothetical protein AM231_19915 [Paenibacillus solani]